MPAPGQFLPRRSGAHRIACIALYRALLIQCPKIPLPDDLKFPGPVNPIKHFIRNRFKKNVFHVSPKIVVSALEAGYAAEQLLRSAASGDSSSTLQIHDVLRKMQARSAHSRSIAKPWPPRPPKPAPYPGAPKLLESRPLSLEKISGGRRRVPIQTYADQFPFLRFKKPQSAFLSRVLRQKLKRRQKRGDKAHIFLEEDIAIGEHEEQWEEHLRRPFGMEESTDIPGPVGGLDWRSGKRNPRGSEEQPWHMEALNSRGAIIGLMKSELFQTQKLGAKMLAVADRERELADGERRKRHQKKFDKWRGRKGRDNGSMD